MFVVSVEEQGDDDYVVTADMLIHQDVDDEHTIEEEEEGECEGTYEDELQDLQKVKNLLVGVASCL